MQYLQRENKKPLGKNLEPKMLDYMNDEQIVQLYELRKAAVNETDEVLK